jgi:hypothetical protein
MSDRRARRTSNQRKRSLPLLALSGHADPFVRCLLSGVKQTSPSLAVRPANDPKRTLAAAARSAGSPSVDI